MSFNINNKLNFIDSLQFLNSSLDSLVKNLDKDDLKYLGLEFDTNVLILVKQKGFYSYECVSEFKRFNEELPSKRKLYSLLTGNKIVIKSIDMLLTFEINLENNERLPWLALKIWCFIVSWCVSKI